MRVSRGARVAAWLAGWIGRRLGPAAGPHAEAARLWELVLRRTDERDAAMRRATEAQQRLAEARALHAAARDRAEAAVRGEP